MSTRRYGTCGASRREIHVAITRDAAEAEKVCDVEKRQLTCEEMNIAQQIMASYHIVWFMANVATWYRYHKTKYLHT